MKTENSAVDIDRNKGDFFYTEVHVRDAGVGLSERTVHYIADVKDDPDWVREYRLRGLKTFLEKPLPTHWASKDLEAIDFNKIRYYLSPGTEPKRSWEEVPDDIERTFIIADEGSEVTYMEGCTAPKFNTPTLHSAVVELVALKGAKIQYITVQNWASNVFNLVTKRGLAHENAEVKWIDCNIGSRLTMKYPGVIMKGRKARGEVLSIALANDGQHQDTGAKMIHAADETTSNIISKSISIGKGRATYRGDRFGDNIAGRFVGSESSLHRCPDAGRRW